MKRTSAILGTLAVIGNLVAVTAMADTSTASASQSSSSVLDKLVLSYWAIYNGPSITNPGPYTNDTNNHGAVGSYGSNGPGNEIQYLDSTLTFGYKITDSLVLAGNYRWFLRPTAAFDSEGGTHYFYRNKDPWASMIAPKLVHTADLNLWADLRVYAPAVSSNNMYSAIRLTQITTYNVPKSRFTLGLYTYERVNLLTNAGASGNLENIDLDVSPFASYQMTPKLAATFWSDVVQATYASVGSATGVPQGWDNETVDLSLGIGWDVTSKLNLNPQVTFFPGAGSINNTTLGMVISAKFL